MDRCECPQRRTKPAGLLDTDVYCDPTQTQSEQFCPVTNLPCREIPDCDITTEACLCPPPEVAATVLSEVSDSVYCDPRETDPPQFCPDEAHTECRNIEGCEPTMDRCECPSGTTTLAPLLSDLVEVSDSVYCDPRQTDPPQICPDVDHTECRNIPDCEPTMDRCECPQRRTKPAGLLDTDVYCDPTQTQPEQFCPVTNLPCREIPDCDITTEACLCPPPEVAATVLS